MPATYEPIATTTLGANSTSITLSSISSAYTDLRIIATGTATISAQIVGLRFNGDTATNYSWTYIAGNGSGATSSSAPTQSRIYCDYFYNSSNPSLIDINVFNYSSTTVNKTALVQNASDQNGSGQSVAVVGLWRSTTAINSITLYTTNAMVTGTTVTIYGIKAA